jgi:hypothetical protein
MWEPIDEDIPPPPTHTHTHTHTRGTFSCVEVASAAVSFSFLNHLLLSPSSFIPPFPQGATQQLLKLYRFDCRHYLQMPGTNQPLDAFFF